MESGRKVKPHANVPLVTWCLSDGRTGHVRQIEGLVARLGDRCEVSVHWIDVSGISRWLGLAELLGGRFPEGGTFPDPHLIIAAGHRTHFPALAAQRARGGRTIVLMRPTIPAPCFDLCLIPEHDVESLVGRVTRLNSVVTRGVLNPFTPCTAADPMRALILIGGPSRHHGWSDRQILEQIREILRLSPTTVRWTLTTSRRTPNSFLNQLLNSADDLLSLDIVPFERTDSGWLAKHLTGSTAVFVSEDSVSMVYESLTAGADVGLLHVPRRGRSRNTRCIDQLLSDRLVIGFDDWRENRFERRRQTPFNEAERCAKIVCQRLLDAA